MLKEEYVISVNIVQCWSWILRIWNPAGESHEGRHSNAALIILETIWSSLPSSLSAPQQFKERKVAGKGTIHVETPGHYLYIWRPFLFSLFLLPGHLLECNEIYPSVKHKAWGLLIGFSSLLEYEITQNASLRLIWSHTALEQPLEWLRHQYPQYILTVDSLFPKGVGSLGALGVSESQNHELYYSLYAYTTTQVIRAGSTWLDLVGTTAIENQEINGSSDQIDLWSIQKTGWFLF